MDPLSKLNKGAADNSANETTLPLRDSPRHVSPTGPQSRPKEDVDDSGWTQVLKGKKSAPLVAIDPFRANPVDTTQTVQKIQADFQLKLKAWQTSTCRQIYFKRLDLSMPDAGWPITKAVCLASGSFSRSYYESTQRSICQLAAFIDTVRYIEQKCSNATPIRIFVQDPAYTTIDKDFFATMNIEVLDYVARPAIDGFGLALAREHLGPNTLVAEFFIDCGFSKLRDFCRADVPLYAFSTFLNFVNGNAAVAVAHPKGYPTTPGEHDKVPNVGPEDRHFFFGEDEDDAQLAADFLRRYNKYSLPEFEPSPNAFHGIRALIRKSREEEEEEGEEEDSSA